MPARPAALAALAAAGAATGVVALGGCAAAPPGGGERGAPLVSVTVDPHLVVGRSRLTIGVTHARHSADAWRHPAAVTRARGILASAATWQNQHIMGFGADNPEPAPGRFSWSSLDKRVALMRATGGTPVLTLCCAPDWMKGGAPGTTDWRRLEVAPIAAHIGDFARLAAAVARRYPDVRRFQVWNELKGFWAPSARHWDVRAYTRLYNAVYDAVKAVRPDAEIGGPYVVLETWTHGPHRSAAVDASGRWGAFDRRALDVLTYWLAHAHGASFVALDGDNAINRDGPAVDAFAGCDAFAAAVRWLRDLDPRRYALAARLPVVWSEWTAAPREAHTSLAKRDAVMASCMITTLRSGAGAVLVWSPEGDQTGRGFPESLWTSTWDAGGGRPTPWSRTQRAFRVAFAPGTPLLATRVAGGPVDALASPRHVLVVNRSRAARRVAVDGRIVRLEPWGVRLIARPGAGARA